MKTDIERNGVRYYCTSEEQLNVFLANGWKVVEKPKKTRKTQK